MGNHFCLVSLGASCKNVVACSLQPWMFKFIEGREYQEIDLGAVCLVFSMANAVSGPQLPGAALVKRQRLVKRERVVETIYDIADYEDGALVSLTGYLVDMGTDKEAILGCAYAVAGAWV